MGNQSELSTGEHYKKALMDSKGNRAEAAKRVFFESSNPKDATFALDFYTVGKAPAMRSDGVSSEPAHTPLAVLYRVRHNKIVQVRMPTLWRLFSPYVVDLDPG
jgi:hypothetical protein